MYNTSVLRKLFEKIVLKRIENSLIERKISFPHEVKFRFRDDHGAVLACFVLKECISFHVKKRSPLFAIFWTMKKLLIESCIMAFCTNHINLA